MEFYLHNYAIEDSCLLCSIYTKTDSLKNKSKFNNIIQIKRDWNEYTTRDGNGLGLISKIKCYILN